MTTSDLIGTDEAARLLGVSKPTVNRMARAGTLPIAMKMPGQTGANLFHRNVVEYVARKQQVA